MVGRIEFLYSGGIGEVVEYDDAEKMVKDVYYESYHD